MSTDGRRDSSLPLLNCRSSRILLWRQRLGMRIPKPSGCPSTLSNVSLIDHTCPFSLANTVLFTDCFWAKFRLIKNLGFFKDVNLHNKDDKIFNWFDQNLYFRCFYRHFSTTRRTQTPWGPSLEEVHSRYRQSQNCRSRLKNDVTKFLWYRRMRECNSNFCVKDKKVFVRSIRHCIWLTSAFISLDSIRRVVID